MDIIERKHAKSCGLATYYTGKLCRNGHLSYRYVTSGTCHDCISSAKRASPLLQDGSVHPAQQAAMSRLTEVQQASEQAKQRAIEAKEQRRQLVNKFFFANEKRWGELRDLVVMFTLGRFPLLTEYDVIPDKCCVKPVANDTSQYRVNMHPDDYAAACAFSEDIHRQEKAKYVQRLIDKRPRGALTKAELAQHYIVDGKSWRPANNDRVRRSTYHHDLGQIIQLTDAWFRFDDMLELVEGRCNFIHPYFLDI